MTFDRLRLKSVSTALAGLFVVTTGWAQTPTPPPAPTLGNYPDTSLPLSTDTTVAPDATPTNTTSINVSTSTNLNGKLEGYPTTGVVRVTDAHPAGTYTVTVRAFNGGDAIATKTFTLTVTAPATCTPLSFAAAANFGAGSGPNSVAVGDFNGDGKQDLAVVNFVSNNVSILLGDGAGNFSAPTNFGAGSYPRSVAVGDFNGDGKQDLAVADYDYYSGNVSVLLGDGTGNFSAASNFGVGHQPDSVAVGDFNGDGKQDLAVANNSSDSSILLGDGTGNFSVASLGVGSAGWSIAVADFNGDGKEDLAVANRFAGYLAILLGDGTGNFSAASKFGVGYDPSSVAVGDFNGDGRQDLAVANFDSNNVSIFRNCAPQLLNTSTRMRVQTENNVLIGGFIITGTGPKRIALRGIGPSLSALGVPDALADPTLELHGPSGELFLQNDNWQSDPAQAAQLTALGLGLQNSNESGLVTRLAPDSYTAILSGKNNGTGVGLVEVYDTDQVLSSELANISTRGFVLTGSNVMIGGFILGGDNNIHVVVRGLGPSLGQVGITNPLADPTLELHDSSGTALASNDNWQDDSNSAAQLTALGLAPENPLESGIYISLAPGAFTAILAGNNGGTGVGLVEVYNVH